MPANTKEVKIRLQSINNTKKITKAMEMVAAAKMRKAVEATLATRTYYSLTWEIVERLLDSRLFFAVYDKVKRFFEPMEKPKHFTLIVVTSNRGLCGAFNSNIIRLVLPFIQEHGQENVNVITLGTRGATAMNSLGTKIKLAYKKDDAALDDTSVREIADHAYHAFRDKKTDKVLIAYTDYESALMQTAHIKQLFPLIRPQDRELIDKDLPLKAPKNLEYLYEPNKYLVLDNLVLRIAQVELYQALLESNASEHSARMVAMKSASDAAGEMSDDLTLLFNKARQASITQEIAEISAGTAAVS